jgi:hypothetical protein
MPNAKEYLAKVLLQQADWRDYKAEEYPDDERNGKAAQLLRDTAARVVELPDDHTLIRRTNEYVGDDDIEFSLGEEASGLLDRVGFGGRMSQRWTVDVVLADLAAAMLVDIAEMQEAHGIAD